MSAPESVGPSAPAPEGMDRPTGVATAVSAGSRRYSLPTREPFCVDWQLSGVAARTPPSGDAGEQGGRR